MAARFLFLHLRRIACSTSDVGSNHFCLPRPCATVGAKPMPELVKYFSSEAVRSEASAAVEEKTEASEVKDDLRSRIFRLRLPKRSATTIIENWAHQGNPISISELRSISRDLRRLQRYKHALEISEWMVSHDEFKLSDSDYAVRIDLMTKVFGVDAAERYFQGLPNHAKTNETYTALLHSYAAAKLTERAENLFETMTSLDLPLTAITYNEMMTLYMSVGQIENVAFIVEELKRRNVEPDLFTYNIWISSCAAALDIDGVRSILDEMSHDKNCNEEWKRYRDLTGIYLSTGQLSNSGCSAIVESEKGITLREWISYDLLILLHAGLGKKDVIDQIWKSLRMTKQKMAGRNYMCALSAYLMLGCTREVRQVIHEWKQCTNSVFNSSDHDRLVGAFADAGFLEKADMLRVLLNEG